MGLELGGGRSIFKFTFLFLSGGRSPDSPGKEFGFLGFFSSKYGEGSGLLLKGCGGFLQSGGEFYNGGGVGEKCIRLVFRRS